MSAVTLLTQVETAISAALLGQAYRMGENWVTRADLPGLWAARERLQREVNQASGGTTIGLMETFPS